jgi:hypothetical protein
MRYRRAQRLGRDTSGITPTNFDTQRIDAVNRRNATKERLVRGQGGDEDVLRLDYQRRFVERLDDIRRKRFTPHQRYMQMAKADAGLKYQSDAARDRRRVAAAHTGSTVGARSGSLSAKERKQRMDAARASANARRGTGSKKKNPQTPETKARERTRIRTETPGTPEFNNALGRVKQAIDTGGVLTVRGGELDKVIDRAKSQGLDYSLNKGVLTITLSTGKKLRVTTSNEEK